MSDELLLAWACAAKLRDLTVVNCCAGIVCLWVLGQFPNMAAWDGRTPHGTSCTWKVTQGKIFLCVMRMVLLPNIGFSFYTACAVLYFPWAFHILEAMFIFFLSGEVFVIPTLIQSWFGMCYEPIEHFLFLKIMFFFIHMYYTTVDPILMPHMVYLLGISHCAGNHFLFTYECAY